MDRLLMALVLIATMTGCISNKQAIDKQTQLERQQFFIAYTQWQFEIDKARNATYTRDAIIQNLQKKLNDAEVLCKDKGSTPIVWPEKYW